MKYYRGTLIASALCMAFCVGLLSSAGYAATKKAKVSIKPSGGKIAVPAYMVAGSLVSKGRVFYRTDVPENSLAGIRLGHPAKDILVKWGNPSRITLGSVKADVANLPSASPQYAPPPGSSLGSFIEPMTQMSKSYANTANSLMDLPGLPGMNVPGAPGGAMYSGPSSGGETSELTQDEVTWTYDLASGITLEFIITDGTITQITVGGNGPWSLSKTHVGLQLGDTYKLVLWVCGYPETQKYVGRFLRVGYVDKSRALFTFLDRKLVGVTIALVPTELK